MGDFNEHVLFGLLTASVFSYFFKQGISLNVPEALASSLAIIVGSVLPDIDHRKAYVHRAVKAFTSIGAAVFTMLLVPLQIHLSFATGSIVFLLVYLGFSLLNMEHRGFTHSISFAATVSSLAVIFSVLFLGSPTPGFATGLGLFSHLILDKEFKLV